MKTPKRSGFTLVELLVVIGILSLLISILLPTLGAARRSANAIKCASNLRAIGQGIANYEANYGGAFPPSNYYVGLQIVNSSTQLPVLPTQGYVHWSSFLYRKTLSANDPALLSTFGWEIFQCPSLQNGGVPPANTYAANSDGLANEAGANVIDLQAPRMSYMLNEALTPRSIFTANFRSGNVRYYHFIKAGRVSKPAETILTSEMSGNQGAMRALSNFGGSTPVSNSRRPVSGISASLSNPPLSSPDQGYTLPLGGTYGWATVDKLSVDPEATFANTSGIPTPDTTLDFIGRNHGVKTHGIVAGSSRGGWDLRKSNFLYVDGHVETKHVAETVYPRSQWGGEFYSLEQ
jgi:prepilin-type N-terminal cleavage/methylation domain-containing protein/prepilin-type processing-associated H-X9-DG protein